MFIGLERMGAVIQVDSTNQDQSGWLPDAVRWRAAKLSERGVARGAPVALSQAASPEFFADLLAVWACGAPAICLDVALTPVERANVVAFSSAKLVLLARGDEPGDGPYRRSNYQILRRIKKRKLRQSLQDRCLMTRL